MNEQDLLDLIAKNRKTESEILEFKEWKTSIPFANGWKIDSDKKRCVYGYCVGIGNEWGGKLLIWVDDKGQIVGTNASLPSDAKSWIFQHTKQKIHIEEVKTSRGKVIIVSIPGRLRGKFFTFNDIPLMRVDDKLLPMDQATQRRILLETEPDWSGLPCKWTTIDDLDEQAIIFAKNKKADISKDESYRTMDTRMFLNQLSLLTENGVPNNTCILFFWKQEVAERKLSAISRILWLYVDEKNGFEDRITPEQQRSPLILTLDRVIEKIQKYNFPLEDFTLFRADPEYQYDEKAVEELLANSLAHRDWTISLPNEIRQTPESLIFSNPGRFENDLERVLEYSHVTPYRNQTMADFLSKINLMENERRWLQKVFQSQLSKWVFVTKEEIDNKAWWIVKMTLDGKIRDKEFAKLVLEEKNLSRIELYLLQKIAFWENILGKDIGLEQAEELKKKWYIELFWRKPNRKVRISYQLFHDINQAEKYILSKGIGTKKKEKLIIEYIEKNWSINTQQVYKIFPEANQNSLRSIIKKMKDRWEIISERKDLYILACNQKSQRRNNRKQPLNNWEI